jgi:hypothetical protein
MRKNENHLVAAVVIIILLTNFSCTRRNKDQNDKITKVSLTLVPPSPVTNQVKLDIRGALWNNYSEPVNYKISVYIDDMTDASRIFSDEVKIMQGGCRGIQFWFDPMNYPGKRNIILVTRSSLGTRTVVEPININASNIRSTKLIDGAWFEFYHWSEDEGRLWNKDIIRLNNTQWEEMIKGMHDIGMDIVIIQELFRNQKYVGEHKMDSTGYTGIPYYASDLYPNKSGKSLLENVQNGTSSPDYPSWKGLAADKPLESVLSEADKCDMKVFLGVGLYAWFDFTKGSLEWSKKVARELWDKYGSHKSFYGWYVSNEIAGNLGTDDSRRKELVNFFKEFSSYVRSFTPDKPVMLATNCHDVRNSGGYYPDLLKYIDILCPFGFHRMPQGDYTGSEVARILQDYCDNAKCHLWMDMEIFLFGEGNALYPRPIDQVIRDLTMFDNFEKICCYAYTGLLNAGWQSIKPGGENTVVLYNDYMKYLVSEDN